MIFLSIHKHYFEVNFAKIANYFEIYFEIMEIFWFGMKNNGNSKRYNWRR